MLKLSWGTKLFIAAGCFMGFIVFMVIRITQTDVPLVETGYYEKGIGYQKNIDAANRQDSLFAIQYNSTQLQLNNKDSLHEIQGNIVFYRANNPSSDHKIQFIIGPANQQVFRFTELEKGNWKCKLSWTHNQLKFEKAFPFTK